MIRRVTSAALFCLALSLPACARSPRVAFYTLEPPAAAQAPAGSGAGPAVAVGPVTLPEVVDRPQLVVRVAPNRVEILESHRWAEPLKSEIPRLVAGALGTELGSGRVSTYREYAGSGAEYRVLLDLSRLEAEPGEGVSVDATWTLRRGGQTVQKGQSAVREKAQGEGYDALVAALSRALSAMGREVAGAIRAEDAKPK